VFEIANNGTSTAPSYASTPTTLVSFCAQANCTDGAYPYAGLIADANGNLFGTTYGGGANDSGTVFEIAGSGFVPKVIFVGTPGTSNCQGMSTSALAHDYGGTAHAAAALGYSSVQVLKNAVAAYCAG
jgi:uncharacterized repeat protein (TIGR03803 family)